MADELEVIRNQMEETRAALADKIEALEDRFRVTVEGATEAATHTVATVQETVSTVREALDLRKQVEHRPWLMMGGAMVVGCIGSRLLAPSRRTSGRSAPGANGAVSTSARNGHARPQGTSSKEEGGVLDDTLRSLQGLAIGTAMNVLRELIENALPDNLVPDAVALVDDITCKLGGTPLSSDANNQDEPKGSQPKGETSDDDRDKTEMGRKMGATQGKGQTSVGFRDRR